MATLPESVDYTDKDIDALRSGRDSSLSSGASPQWTDFDVASFGHLLVELSGFVVDVLTVYQDKLPRESRLATATQRKSVMALAKMLGYRLHGRRAAATAEVRIQLARGPVACSHRARRSSTPLSRRRNEKPRCRRMMRAGFETRTI